MEKEVFLTEISEIKSPEEHVMEEMSQDKLLFSEQMRTLLEKKMAGKRFTSKEGNLFEKEKNKWWQDKYGFPYSLKAARNELILRKYAPSEKSERARVLQNELLVALEKNDGEKLQTLKKQYFEEFPDQLEGIEVIFGLNDFFGIQEKMKKDRKENGDNYRETSKEDFKSLTEYQFLFTHFIIQNKNDKEFLRLFWEIGSRMAEKVHHLRDFHILQRGLLSQAAAFHLTRQLEISPRLSHPKEDAFNAIDLWTSSDVALQIKGHHVEKPAILESETISFPAVETTGESKFFLDAYHQKQFSRFQAKVSEYGKLLNRDIAAYMLIIPYSKINFITGEPDKDLVEFFRDKLKGKQKESESDKE